MSLGVTFGHGHTLDIGPWVNSEEALQGIVFETVSTTMIDGKRYGVLRCIGITRPELEYAYRKGTTDLLSLLKRAGYYPNTELRRRSIL
jgi:hypothetical protein